jgi:hypothetical protein
MPVGKIQKHGGKTEPIDIGLFGKEKPEEPTLFGEEKASGRKAAKAPSGEKVLNKSLRKPSQLIEEAEKKTKPMSTAELTLEARKIFPDVAFRQKNLDRWRGGILGMYYHQSGLVKTRNEVDIDTIAHEVAHWWQEMIFGKIRHRESGFVGKEIREELGNLDYDPEKQRISEGFAEFVRLWATGQPVAEVAPKFTEFFEKQFLKDHDSAGKFGKLKELLTAYRLQGTDNFLEAQLGFNRPRNARSRLTDWVQKTVKRPIRDTVDHIAYAFKKIAEKWYDDAAPAQWLLKKALSKNYNGLLAKENPIVLYRNYKMTAGAMAEEMVHHGVYDFRSGDTVTRGIFQILKEVRTKGHSIKDFIKYIYSKHALEWIQNGKNPGLTKDQAQYIIDRYRNEDFDRLGNQITRYFDTLLLLVGREGGISTMAYTKMKEKRLGQPGIPDQEGERF